MTTKEEFLKALEKLDDNEGYVIGSYVSQLEKTNKLLAKQLINSTTFNLELMDEQVPQWREHSKQEIESLIKLLK